MSRDDDAINEILDIAAKIAIGAGIVYLLKKLTEEDDEGGWDD